MRFIEPNRLMATGMSKPVGRSNSSAGPPPGDFETPVRDRGNLEIGVDRLADERELVLGGEGAEEVVEILVHGFRGSGFKVQGLGSWVQSSGSGSRFKIIGSDSRAVRRPSATCLTLNPEP